MITWKEKVSMFGMRAIMKVVVVCSVLVKPALSVVENYKKKYEDANGKAFLERVRQIFDYTDIPLADANVINLETPQGKVCRGCIGKKYCKTYPVHGVAALANISDETIGKAIDNLRDVIYEVEETIKMPYLKSDTWPEPIAFTSGFLQTNPLISTPIIFETQKDILPMPLVDTKVADDMRADLWSITHPSKKSSAEEIEQSMQKGLAKIDHSNRRKRQSTLADNMVSKGLCKSDIGSVVAQDSEIAKWSDDTLAIMEEYVRTLPAKPYSDSKETLLTEMEKLVSNMGGETKDINMKDIQRAAKQANKKKPTKKTKTKTTKTKKSVKK